MAKEDEEKTAFITPCGTYCFIRMPFGLKNAGSTFARVVYTAFEPQIHRNVEAYMDDIVVKSKSKDTLIQDLEETFENLRKIQLKLNPEKCVFGVPSGKLLGFFVSQRGIKANPDKIKAIEQIEAPKRVKDVRSRVLRVYRGPNLGKTARVFATICSSCSLRPRTAQTRGSGPIGVRGGQFPPTSLARQVGGVEVVRT